MKKIVLTSKICEVDTIESIGSPVTVLAVLANTKNADGSPVFVTVPLTTTVGDVVILSKDGSAPTSTLDSTNLFTPAQIADQFTEIQQ
jgi:hypothetical protein